MPPTGWSEHPSRCQPLNLSQKVVIKLCAHAVGLCSSWSARTKSCSLHMVFHQEGFNNSLSNLQTRASSCVTAIKMSAVLSFASRCCWCKNKLKTSSVAVLLFFADTLIQQVLLVFKKKEKIWTTLCFFHYVFAVSHELHMKVTLRRPGWAGFRVETVTLKIKALFLFLGANSLKIPVLKSECPS